MLPFLNEAFPATTDRKAEASALFHECVVLNTVSGTGQNLYVQIPYYSNELRFGPVRYNVKAGPTYPTLGDSGLVVRSEPTGLYWLLVYGV